MEAIWNLLVKRPEDTKLGRLYALVRKSGRGHARGRRVELHESELPDDVRYAILRDPQYERPVRLRLVRADDKVPELPLRRDVCEERGYNIVNMGEVSRGILNILEGARVRFYIDQFREDYETFARHLEIHPRNSTRKQRRGRDQFKGLVAALRPIYEQTAGIVPEERGEAVLYEGKAVFRPRSGRERNGYITIKSRFFRAVNRRFHAADFWPEHVSGEFRNRWFGLAPLTPRWPGEELDEEEQFVNLAMADAYVERDVSASQTQILAAFLGNDALATLAASRNPKFKVYLAQQLWQLHERDNVLADGYTGPTDPRLVEFIGEIWMRRNYGGQLSQTVLDLAEDSDTYGPGWNTRVFATGGIRRAMRFFQAFLATLPAWSADVTTFLDACTYIGRSGAATGGVVLKDPLDGAEIRWNPIMREKKGIPVFDKLHVEANLSGVRRRVGVRWMFVSQPWQVDRRALSQMVAPCLVHTLDAYFNALVIRELHDVGAKNIIAIHDSWFVPIVVRYFDREGVQIGERALAAAIEEAGQGWLTDSRDPHYTQYGAALSIPGMEALLGKLCDEPARLDSGIRVIYDWFLAQLTGSPYESSPRGCTTAGSSGSPKATGRSSRRCSRPTHTNWKPLRPLYLAAYGDVQRSLTEALEQRTATSEILRVISGSPSFDVLTTTAPARTIPSD